MTSSNPPRKKARAAVPPETGLQPEPAILRAVPGTEVSPGMPLQAVLVARVAARNTGPLLAALASCPGRSLHHLKRIREVPLPPGAERQLDVLLSRLERTGPACPATGLPQLQAPAAVVASLEGVRSAILAQRHILVPAQALAALNHRAAWGQIWPLQPHVRPTAEPEALRTSPQPAQAARLALRVKELAEASSQAGDVKNAALLVDPCTEAVVAEGKDGTHRGQAGALQHAVLAALAAAAARDRENWPQARAQHHWLLAAEAGAAAPPATAKSPPECLGPGPAANPASGSPAVQGSEERVGGTPLSKPYLCTGLDCYVYREPCLYCAMALTHARVHRVLYVVPDLHRGALGGRQRLHGVPSLNHHLKVWQVAVG